MFIHDLDSTASYRALARGFGHGFAQAYQASRREHAGSRTPGSVDLGGMRSFAGTSALDASRAERRRFGS